MATTSLDMANFFGASLNLVGKRSNTIWVIESINSITQTARRRARGFRNFANLKAVCYWMAGDLNFRIPSAFAHP